MGIDCSCVFSLFFVLVLVGIIINNYRRYVYIHYTTNLFTKTHIMYYYAKLYDAFDFANDFGIVCGFISQYFSNVG